MSSEKHVTVKLPFVSQDSTNLDMLRSVAVLLVLLDHTLKFFGHEYVLGSEVNWWGRLGVALFFVHTSLVLMLSLERSKVKGWRLPASFYIRRAFRILPLSAAVVLLVWLLNIPQLRVLHLGFAQAHVPPTVLLSNLTLTQNLFANGFNILGQLWSLPIELDMYLVFPLLYILATRRGLFFVLAAWPVAVMVAAVATAIPSLWRVNFLQFAPCFVPGVMAFALSKKVQSRLHPWLFPLALALVVGVFLAHSAWPMAWVVCLLLGVSIPFFRDQGNVFVNRISHRIAKYSYGVYLGHTLCIWAAFCALSGLPRILQWPLFAVLLVAVPYVMFVAIERPGIELGKRVSMTIIPTPKRLPVESATSVGCG